MGGWHEFGVLAWFDFIHFIIWRVLLSFPSGAKLKNLESASWKACKFDLYDAAAALWANGMDYKA